jgi:hypothetical protein
VRASRGPDHPSDAPARPERARSASEHPERACSASKHPERAPGSPERARGAFQNPPRAGTAPVHAARASARASESADRARARLAAWAMPPLLLASVACGVAVVLRAPRGAFAVAAGSLFAVAIAWILVSVFFPARAERRCPGCGQETLERAGGLRGLACERCGWRDDEASAFLLAEAEDAPLEPLVLAERDALAGAAAERRGAR